MEEKQFEKESAAQKKAINEFRTARTAADRETHSENKKWEYDHKTGKLVPNRRK